MGKTKFTEYYDLLGVETDATSQQLTKAYRKTALRLHPDRGGNPEDFKQMKAAYDVLCDPNKRKLYDQYGPGILKMMDGEGGPEAMYATFASIGTAERTKAGIAILMLSLLVLLTPILLSLLWDGTAMYEWAVVFIPLWLLQSALLIGMFVFMRVSPPADEADLDDEGRALFEETKRVISRQKFWGSLYILLFVAFEVLFSLRMPEHVTFSWFIVFLPLFVYEILHFCWSVIKTKKQWLITHHPGRDQVSGHFRAWTYWLMVIDNTVWGMIHLITWILVAARADGIFEGSWYLVALPILVGELFSLVYHLADTKPATAREGEPPRQMTMCEKLFGWLFGNVMLLTIVLVGAAKLDGAEFSSFVVWIPLFILVSCCCCVSTCLVLCVTPENLRAAAEEAAAEQQNGNDVDVDVSESSRLHDPEVQTYNTGQDSTTHVVGEGVTVQDVETTAIVMD